MGCMAKMAAIFHCEFYSNGCDFSWFSSYNPLRWVENLKTSQRPLNFVFTVWIFAEEFDMFWAWQLRGKKIIQKTILHGWDKKVRKTKFSKFSLAAHCRRVTFHIGNLIFLVSLARLIQKTTQKKKLDSKHTAEKIQFVNETNTRSAYLRDDRECFFAMKSSSSGVKTRDGNEEIIGVKLKMSQVSSSSVLEF